MKSNKHHDMQSSSSTHFATPTRDTLEGYGDIFCLNAYPWIDQRSNHGEDVPYEAMQKHRDTVNSPIGRVERYWKVKGDSDIGLPRQSEHLLYLTLIRKTVSLASEDGMIEYAYGDLAACLGLGFSPHSYRRVHLALLRLNAVQVRFTGTITLPDETELSSEVSFGFLSALDMIAEHDKLVGRLCWNRRVLASLRAMAHKNHSCSVKAIGSTGETQTVAPEFPLPSTIAFGIPG